MSAKTSTPNITYLHCRFCAQKKSVFDLLNFEKDKESYKDYEEKVKYFATEYFHFYPDSAVPKTICENCYVELEASYCFVEKVKKSLEFLTTLYNVKSEPGPCFVRAEPKINIKVEITNSDSDDADDSVVTENAPNTTEVEVSNTFKVDCELLPSDNVQMSDNIEMSDLDSDDEEPEDTTWFTEEEISKNKTESVENRDSYSWTGYPWMCGHCGEKFDTMQLVRDHSKVMHNMCYAYQCADCDKSFTTFNLFIEHVRYHRNLLSYFCQYCNTWFETKQQCKNHTPTHWSGPQCICEMCGEIYPDFISLEHHKKSYKRPKLSKRERRMKPKQVIVKSQSKDLLDRSWLTYPWTCQDCSMKFSDVVLLRSHVQHLHKKCFSMKCVDCLKEMKHYRGFVDHVTNHRRFLKKFCPYCNEYKEDPDEILRHIEEHFNGPQRPCDGCGQIFDSNQQVLKHMKEFDPPRRKGTITKADLECDLCGKLSSCIATARKHRLVHNIDRIRFHTCNVCGKAFYDAATLRDHIRTHSQSRSEVCQICNLRFRTKLRLKNHVKTHSDVKPFECHDCGKTFKTKARIFLHMKIHSDEKPFKCPVCEKEFRYNNGLKTHMHQHTGLRPYNCEVCEKTFANWANCNKHMIRKHGLSLARTKHTEVGRVTIDRETGKPTDVVCDQTTKAWAVNLLKKKRLGSRKDN